jgi:hypothetical protein
MMMLINNALPRFIPLLLVFSTSFDFFGKSILTE